MSELTRAMITSSPIDELNEIAKLATAALAQIYTENCFSEEPPTVNVGIVRVVLRSFAEVV